MTTGEGKHPFHRIIARLCSMPRCQTMLATGHGLPAVPIVATYFIPRKTKRPEETRVASYKPRYRPHHREILPVFVKNLCSSSQEALYFQCFMTNGENPSNDYFENEKSSLYIFPFSHSYSVFRSFSKQQDCLMLGFLDISCLKPQAGAICAYSKQNVVP